MGMRKTQKVDYYLASEDCDPTGGVHEVRRIKRLRYASRDDILLVKVDPPFEGRRLGVRIDLLGALFIASRWTTRPLFPVVGWPVAVYILAPMRRTPESVDEIFNKDVRLVGWGELYPTAEWAADPYGHAKSLDKD